MARVECQMTRRSNHALQPTRRERHGCNRNIPGAAMLIRNVRQKLLPNLYDTTDRK
jgi:hypothetical protein